MLHLTIHPVSALAATLLLTGCTDFCNCPNYLEGAPSAGGSATDVITPSSPNDGPYKLYQGVMQY